MEQCVHHKFNNSEHLLIPVSLFPKSALLWIIFCCSIGQENIIHWTGLDSQISLPCIRNRNENTHFSPWLSSDNSLTRLTFMLYLRPSKLTMPYLIRPQPVPFEIMPCLKWATTTSFSNSYHALRWPQLLQFELIPYIKRTKNINSKLTDSSITWLFLSRCPD